MTAIRDALKGYKTYIVAAIGVLTALVGFTDGTLSPVAALLTALNSVGLSTLRAAIAKNG